MKINQIVLLSWLILVFAFISCRQDKTRSSDVKLTLTQGTNMAAVVSPNGQSIVFDVLGQLWMMPSEGGKALAITDKYGNARQPSWSPNGSQITFQGYWEGNWHIYIVHRDGSGLKRITDKMFDHREPHWSPDGQKIIFSADDEGSYDLYEYDLQTGKESRITSGPSNEYSPAWSPDGERIGYLSDNPDQKGVHVIDRDREVDELIYHSDNSLQGFAWNYDGSGVTLVEQSFGKSSLTYVPVDNPESGHQMISGEEEDVFGFKSSWIDEETFIYTADGHIKRKSLGSQSTAIVPLEIDVTLERREYVYKTRNYEAEKDLPVKGLAWPDLSPDGQRIAVVMMGDLYIVDRDGTAEQLTNDGFLEMHPEWSPDQEEIAYQSDRSGSFHIYIRNLKDGSDRLASEISGAHAGLAWSSDGSKIAFTTSFGPRLGKASYVELETGRVVEVSATMSSSLGAPTWSPDGKILAFTRLEPYSSLYREGVNGIVRYDVDGSLLGGIGDMRMISIGDRQRNGPLWSPDGRYMAAVSFGKLILIPVDDQGVVNGEVIEVTEDLADNPSWSGNGRELAYIATDQLTILNVDSREIIRIPIKKTWNRVVPGHTVGIHAGSLFDGINAEVRKDVDIIIENNRIARVVPHSEASHDQVDQWIDASDRFVMPGLIESHTHQGSWGGEKLGRAWLAWGITSTRNPASDPYDELNRREGIESGHLVGPRNFFTGSPIDGNRIYYGGASALGSAKQIDLEIQRAAALDYDLVKTYVRLSDPLQQKVIDKAHELGIPVSSHELYPAVAYGIDGVEHIKGTSRRGYSPKMSHVNLAYSDVVDLIARSGMTFTPTTGIYTSFNYLIAQDDSVLDDPRISAFVEPFGISSIKAGLTQIRENPVEWKIHFEKTMSMITDIHRAGGLIIAGTDSPIIPYGFSLHMEMVAYAEGGMPNFEVLKTATGNAAIALNAQGDIGSIRQGMLADIIILEKSPVENIQNTRTVSQVMINGNIYKVEDLVAGPELK